MTKIIFMLFLCSITCSAQNIKQLTKEELKTIEDISKKKFGKKKFVTNVEINESYYNNITNKFHWSVSVIKEVKVGEINDIFKGVYETSVTSLEETPTFKKTSNTKLNSYTKVSKKPENNDTQVSNTRVARNTRQLTEKEGNKIAEITKNKFKQKTIIFGNSEHSLSEKFKWAFYVIEKIDEYNAYETLYVGQMNSLDSQPVFKKHQVRKIKN